MRTLFIALLIYPLAIVAFGAEWEFTNEKESMVATFKAEGRLHSTIVVPCKLAVPGGDIAKHSFVDPGAEDQPTFRRFTVLGVQAGSLLVEVAQEEGMVPHGEKKRITLYFEMHQGEAAIPICGGAAPPQVLYVKATESPSTFRVRLAPYTAPKD